jgi:hypothetical protein
MTVKHNNLANGDRIRMEAGGQVEWMAVASAPGGSAGAYTYTITRNLDGTGANAWVAGDAIVNTGTTNDGFIDLYSTSGVLSGVGPTIVGSVRTGTSYNNIAARWAIGNLNGLYGYAADTYGAAFGNPSGAWVKIDATNGVRLGHNTATVVQISAAGASTFEQGISIGASGSLTAGGVILNSSGLFISPISAGGGGAYANANAVRWSTSLTNRTAIWRSDNPTLLLNRTWHFDHITDVATESSQAVTDVLNQSTSGAAWSAAKAVLWSQFGNVSDYTLSCQRSSGGNHALLNLWLGSGGTDMSCALGVGSRSGVGLVSLTTGIAISPGSITVTGPASFSAAIYDYGRLTPQGTWLTRTFGGGNYLADTGTFAVLSGQVFADNYMQVGKTLFFSVTVIGASISAATPAYLMFVLPLGASVDKRTEVTADIRANGTYERGQALTIAGETFVRVYRSEAGYAAWPLSGGNVDVRFTIPVSTV